MGLNKKYLVDIPSDDGVHVKTAGAKKERYVYKYVKYFRNAEGKPRNKSKAIGKFDPNTGKMVPNKNYFDLYKIDPAMPAMDVWDYGYSYLVLKVCQDIGLFDCLVNAFSEERAMDIVVIASYLIRCGNTMDGIDDWQQRNYFPGPRRLLTSQSTSKLFGTLSAQQINRFFSDWVKIFLGDRTVCYDVTSVSSYAQHIPAVERGYNRDGENLAQFNIGMFCDEGSKIPIYYNVYNGSLTDKTNLSYVLANAEAIGIHRVKMVVDGGFMDRSCLATLSELCASFTVGLPAHLKESQAIMEKHGAGIDHYANELDVPHTFGKSIDAQICGVAGKVMLYYDSWNHLFLCNELSERIHRLKAEVSGLKRYPKNKLKRYEPYFILTKHPHGSGFDYAVDINKVEHLRKHKGLFLLFTTDMEATLEDTLYHYRAKDVVEKLFDQIKCDMEGNRIRTHTEQTTEGKVFVTFIACVIRAYLLSNLHEYLKANSTSLKKALNQLSNITIVSGAEGFRFTKALSKKQKEILKPFGADVSIVAGINE